MFPEVHLKAMNRLSVAPVPDDLAAGANASGFCAQSTRHIQSYNCPVGVPQKPVNTGSIVDKPHDLASIIDPRGRGLRRSWYFNNHDAITVLEESALYARCVRLTHDLATGVNSPGNRRISARNVKRRILWRRCSRGACCKG